MRPRHIIHWGPLYWTPQSYRTGMSLLRSRGERSEMLQRVAENIGTRSVLELCCGPGDLTNFLPGNPYQGIDLNPEFLRPLLRRGFSVQQGDILSVAWPAVECLVIVDSFYQFLGSVPAFLSRLAQHPCERVVISEPMENLISRLPAWLVPGAAWLMRVEGTPHPERFTETRFRDLLEPLGFQQFTRIGHNRIAVWDRHG